MLKSYEAIYENGQVKWLAEQPEVNSARIIVTVLEENPSPAPAKRRSPHVSIAGKGKTLDDIVSPIVDEQDWFNPDDGANGYLFYKVPSDSKLYQEEALEPSDG